jgi:nicotinamidase-related amidase
VDVVDMWDDHWCKGAAARVGELAPKVDALLKDLRGRGALIVHAPSSVTSFYARHPARRRAQEAPPAVPSAPLATEQRWGTAWCWPDPARGEADLPIDDSDMGCDCATPCKIREAWTRQTASIAIDGEKDAITDNGQELVNLFAALGIRRVLILGVHLNMCVLGRPMGIRQLVRLGYETVLVRDLTDTMYNSKMRPKVDHHTGTDLVVGHVEKHWCATTTSDLLGAPAPFRFRDDPKRDRPR